MKLRYSLTITLLIAYSMLVFCQSPIVKIQRYGYSGDFGKWILIYEEDNSYENDVLLKSSKTTFDVDADSILLSNFHYEEYDDVGNLVFEYDTSNLAFGWYSRSRTNYFYKEELLSEIISTGEGLEVEDHQVYFKKKYEYNDEGQLLSEFVEYPSSESSGFFQKIIYDENGCIHQLEHRRHLGHPMKKSIYERDATCEILAEIRFEKENDSEFYEPIDSSVIYRFVEDADWIKLDSVYRPMNDDNSFKLIATYWRRTETNSDGTLAKRVWGWVDSNYSTDEYFYDEHKNLIREENRTESLNFSWVSIDRFKDIAYEYEKRLYDYTNRSYIVKKREEGEGINNTPLIPAEWEYEYFCSGELKSVLYKSISNAAFPATMTYYDYLNKTDCDVEDLESSVKIYPNPSDGFVKIESNILESETARISVFNALGQQVFKKEKPFQSYFVLLDLSHLNNGNYVIFIENGDYFSTEKITIFR